MQSRQKFCFKLRVNFGAVISVFDVAANICIEKNRIDNFVAVGAETFNGNVYVKPDIIINDAEGNRSWRAVFIADNFFGVKVINALVASGIAAESKAFLHGEENILNTFCDGLVVVEERRFS